MKKLAQPFYAGLFGLGLMLVSGVVQAETIEIKMLNRGEIGPMAFEPAYVEIQPGDSVKFVVGQKGHNAATIDGFVPEGYEGFKGQINEEIEVKLDQPGFYGIKCSPHYAMGMVALIKVGDAELTDEIRTQKFPGRAKKRFEDLFAKAAE